MVIYLVRIVSTIFSTINIHSSRFYYFKLGKPRDGIVPTGLLGDDGLIGHMMNELIFCRVKEELNPF